MSVMHVTKPDLLAGSGDCSGIHPEYKISKPPARKCPHVYRSRTCVKSIEPRHRQVETAETKLTPRKRSQTMIEIERNKPPSSPKLLKEEKMTCPESTDAMLKELKEKDLARRVYARFLLNAWRRKREQLASYSECIRHLENQVHQLQLQTTFLRNLRENESARRTEASLESKKLETELEEKSIECRRAVEEKEAYEIVVRNLEITVGRLQNEIERGRKEAASQQSEKYDLQEQIGREREKKLNLMNEKQCLLEKIAAMENVTCQQQINVDRLREIAEDLEKKLQEKMFAIHETTKQKDEACEKLMAQESAARKLDQEVKQRRKAEKKLRIQLQTVQNKAMILEENNLSLKLDCASLKATVLKTEESLSKVTNRPWWKTPALCALKVATILLPALPPDLTPREEDY